MKPNPNEPELFGREIAAAQPRARQQMSARVVAAIDTMRRYGFVVSRAGGQHLCRRRQRHFQLDDRQIQRFAADLVSAGPPPAPKTGPTKTGPTKTGHIKTGHPDKAQARSQKPSNQTQGAYLLDLAVGCKRA